MPAAFGGSPVVWAAWLYYEEGLTQDEIARRIGVSRASVNNLLQTARDEGVVTISVAPAHLSRVSLAQEISERFGIGECLVIPDDDGRRPDHERVGVAGARLLAERLQPDDVLGVSWGRTVLALSEALPFRPLPGLSVVQVTGSAIGTYRFAAELCTSNIANRLGGRCIYLHAPGIVSRPAVKRVLMAEPTVREQFHIIGSCNRIVFGVGSVESSSTAFESGFLTPGEARPYIEAGAVGVLAGRFLDGRGSFVRGSMDDRLIGITLDAIRSVPDRICVAAGPAKVAAIRATMAGGFVTTLVTDQRTATALLEAR
ncbi:sugar-binding transcriptional regulator [Rhizosaccharibacter radicis]|uniref:Sugar-binding transcriptional regulator n=1 Tax=Rhizosaccharibacter radicis TaxID=2782605 RepID=A0ABT1W0N8_9PROT|nr:sugar-binding transcriptional regulator [Acetobacteraceae bacterium KSS12]